jgi:hypothetical protein
MQVTDGASILERVALVRTSRSGFLDDVSCGRLQPDRIGTTVADDPALFTLYAVKVAEALPGLGKVMARRSLARHGVDELSPAGDVASEVWPSIAAAVVEGEPQ